MPLIETVTGPDLRTPEEVAEAILLVGRVCRSTGHVRVGIGASRQDVNVSVRGGRRVEIKGVPKAGWAPRLVHAEAVRQVNLIGLRDELARRGFASEADVAVEHADVTEMFTRSPLEPLRRESWQRFVEADGRRPGFELGGGAFCVRAVRLPGLAGVLSWPTQPGRTFADELAGRVRVVAGLDQPPILLHSEAWPRSDGGPEELAALRRRLGCEDADAVVLVWGCEDDTVTAADEIRIRFVDAMDGVPHETRQPFADGSTDFERILPGPDRMYPDTDHPPEPIRRDRVERLRVALPEPPWEREARYAAVGVPTDTVRWLIRRNGARLVDLVVAEARADLRRAAFFFGERFKGWRRAGVAVDTVTDDQWVAVFRLFRGEPLAWDRRDDLVRWLADHPGEGAEAAVREMALGDPPDGWREHVRDVARDTEPDGRDRSPERRARLALGLALNGLRGRVPVAEVAAEVVAAEVVDAPIPVK